MNCHFRITLNSAPQLLRYDIVLPWGASMPDLATAALLRAVLDEVCENVPRHEAAARTIVASGILEAASRGDRSPDRLNQIGRAALSDTPTMWR